jgi:tetratricopeptide (TPR) repeat protein
VPQEITTAAEAQDLGARITALLDGGDPDAAIALAEAASGDDTLVTQLRAWAYTEGGQQKEDWGSTSHERDLWRALAGRARDFGYNLANAEQALFELAVKEHGHLKALERHHEHLERARRGFEGVADDADAPNSLKLQALTNLGNSYDRVGRDLDALEVWERALAIDSGFAMALGNVGVALAGVAPFMGEHAATVRQQAVEALDAALVKPEDIVGRGGPRALEHFKRARARLPEAKRIPKGRTRFDEPHLEWCRRHELFLHVSHRCLREEVQLLDPLFFRGLLVGIEDEDQQRVKDLVDAFNSIKQAYVSARYLTWLATGRDAPLREEMEELRKHVVFLDSLEYARFGIRTGIAVQAFTAATNVLDQVASFVHLYLESERRVSDVYFKRLWHRQGRNRDGQGPSRATPAAVVQSRSPRALRPRLRP